MPSPCWSIGSLLAAATLAACAHDITPPPDRVDEEAERFATMADSLRDEGDERGGEWLDHLSSLVRLAGGATAITIDIDGESHPFLAVAEEIEVRSPPCFASQDVVCPQLPPRSMRTLVAWDPAEPRRQLRLSADTGSSAGETYVPRTTGGGALVPSPGEADTRLPGDTAAILPMPRRGFTLFFAEPSSGSWYLLAGTQTNERTALGGSCGAVSVRIFQGTYECTRARFLFEATTSLGHVFPSADLADPPRSRTMVIPRQAAQGVRLIATYAPPPPPDDSAPPPVDTIPPSPPPDTVRGGLRHALFVSVDSAGPVRLTLSVTNRDAIPITIGFTTSQHYDFEIRSAETGALLWQWSADKAFTQALTSRTLAPGEEMRVSERWNQTQRHGRVVAGGMLASHTHPLAARVALVIP